MTLRSRLRSILRSRLRSILRSSSSRRRGPRRSKRWWSRHRTTMLRQPPCPRRVTGPYGESRPLYPCQDYPTSRRITNAPRCAFVRDLRDRAGRGSCFRRRGCSTPAAKHTRAGTLGSRPTCTARRTRGRGIRSRRRCPLPPPGVPGHERDVRHPTTRGRPNRGGEQHPPSRKAQEDHRRGSVPRNDRVVPPRWRPSCERPSEG
jgi:hypothetical protein